MPVQVDPASPDDLDAIAALLGKAFDAPPDAAFLDRRLLEWKYFEPFGARSLPRSYVLRRDGAVMAHCVAMPMDLRVAGGRAGSSPLPAVCFMDWAGSRELPGAGSILMKKLLAQSAVAIVAGGSTATRQTIPRLGFRIHGAVELFARVIRPWRQARSRPSAGAVKNVARLARNTWWSVRPAGASRGWCVRPVEAFQRLIDSADLDTAAQQSPQYL